MKTIERLIRKNATEIGTWEPTHYLSLKQAKDANPGEYPSHFRIATREPVRSTIISGYPTTHKTRFSELGYWMVEPGCWQCVDLTGDKPAQVGTQYVTKAELLANLEAYATEYGCDGANPKTTSMQWCEDCQGMHDASTSCGTERPVRPIDLPYDGQAHYMAKAAQSLVLMLTNLDYSKFGVADTCDLTTSFHQLIKYIEAKKLA